MAVVAERSYSAGVLVVAARASWWFDLVAVVVAVLVAVVADSVAVVVAVVAVLVVAVLVAARGNKKPVLCD